MKPFWIETGNALRVAIVPRPRGGDRLDDEIAAIKRAGIDILVSMLPEEEALELGLAEEARACQSAGIDYFRYPIVDREVPASSASFAEFLDRLRVELHAGRSLAVHCRASIGRSSLLLAAILCREGLPPRDAFRRLSQARGMHVPDTFEQVLWVERFAANDEPVER